MRLYQKRIRFTPRGPWMKGRRSYALLRDEVDDQGVRTQRDVTDPRIEALTREYQKALERDISAAKLTALVELGRLALYEIKKEHEKDVAKLRKEVPLSAFNSNILDSYIKAKVLVKTASKRGSINADIAHATRAMWLLGANSIKTVDLSIIQNILNKSKSSGENKYLILNFRRLLKFVGRHDDADNLRGKRFGDVKPPYLTPEQVDTLVRNVPDDVLARHPVLPELIKITFNLGTRISESLAIEAKSVKKEEGSVVVKIDKQWVRPSAAAADGSDRLRETKNRTVRNVMPLDVKETLRCLDKWLKTCPTHEDREPYRWAIDTYLRTACKKLFTQGGADDMEFDLLDIDSIQDAEDDRVYKAVHMLRAGHAVEMMARTSDNSAFVAKQLGDTEDVVRRHYSGRTNQPKSIKEMAKIIYKR